MKTAHLQLQLDLTAASSNTQPIRLPEHIGYSILAKWGASTSRGGTLKLQATNNAYYKLYDTPPNPAFADMQEEVRNTAVQSDVVWEDIPGSEKTIDATADQHLWNVSDVFYSAVRIIWTQSAAGAASPDLVTAHFHGKGFRS